MFYFSLQYDSKLKNLLYGKMMFIETAVKNVPLWSLFEILTLGDFGFLLSCLNYDMRNDISHRLGINTSSDTDRHFDG